MDYMFERHAQNQIGGSKMKKLTMFIAIALVVVFMSGTVYAYPQVYLKETGVNPGSGDLSFVFPAFPSGVGAYYGEYDLLIDWDNAGNSLGYAPISGFCVEDAYSTSANGVVYEVIPVGDWGQNYRNAAWVFSQYKMHLVSAQAAQIAIWELVMDDGNFNPKPNNGNFYATSTNGYVTEAYNLLNPSGNPLNLGNYNGGGFSIVHNPVGSTNPQDYQDYIIYTAEPSILLLLGFGMIGLVGFGRKFRKQS
jgi:hypothetical protein